MVLVVRPRGAEVTSPLSVASNSKTQSSGLGFQVLCLLVALAWLWFQLLNHLRIEWSLNEQYNYGWAVPFMALYLLWQGVKHAGSTPHVVPYNRRAQRCEQASGESGRPDPGTPEINKKVPGLWPSFRGPLITLTIPGLCILYLPTRLAQEANPDWRLVSWALSLEVVGITLMVLMQGFARRGTEKDGSLNREIHETAHGGWSRVLNPSVFLFPVCFILVAVPWPTLIEGPLIQTLTHANVSATVEILNLFGVPALQHGNVIEVSSGPVGIDDACSGIRSFQASLMIALFLGHLFRLTVSRRVCCVFAGFAFSFIFNVGRTVLLTYVASVKGSAAIRSWHDPAGVTILVGCFLGLWAVAEFLRKRQGMEETMDPRPRNADLGPGSLVLRVPFALAAWLLFAEVAVEGWYRWHERQLPAPVAWTVSLPESAPGFRRLPFSERTSRILRFDDALNAAWTGPTGSRWQAIFLRWKPGRTAVHLARNHTPEFCLSATGRGVVSQSDIQRYDVPLERRLAAGATQSTNQLVIRMPFRVYQVADPTGPLHVFHCLWDDRASDQGVETMALTYANRMGPVLAGRRQSGQRSLEVAVWGYTQPAEAERDFRETLPKWLVAE